MSKFSIRSLLILVTIFAVGFWCIEMYRSHLSFQVRCRVLFRENNYFDGNEFETKQLMVKNIFILNEFETAFIFKKSSEDFETTVEEIPLNRIIAFDQLAGNLKNAKVLRVRIADFNKKTRSIGLWLLGFGKSPIKIQVPRFGSFVVKTEENTDGDSKYFWFTPRRQF